MPRHNSFDGRLTHGEGVAAFTPVAAIPSATVVMLRDASEGPELLMVKRRAGDAFGDSYTFPGGLVDDNEGTAHSYCRGITAEDANSILGVPEGGLDFYSAAIRELFEETGILLAQDAQGCRPSMDTGLQDLRVQVDKAELSWSEFLHGQGLQLPCDTLHYFAHWETPSIIPKRWSARFFFAEMPSDQNVKHDGNELTDSRWITARQALAASRNGDMKLPFATVRNLKTFSDIDSIDGLIAWAGERAAAGVQKIRPVRVEVNGTKQWTIPGDAHFPGN